LGFATVVAQDLTIGAGGMLTNDGSGSDRSRRRGTINLTEWRNAGGNTQTYFNIQEDLNIAAGATIDIGSTRLGAHSRSWQQSS
jgi:hypothetical protein